MILPVPTGRAAGDSCKWLGLAVDPICSYKEINTIVRTKQTTAKNKISKLHFAKRRLGFLYACFQPSFSRQVDEGFEKENKYRTGLRKGDEGFEKETKYRTVSTSATANNSIKNPKS